jgi:nucleotide-binding universal stress UspA family protein
VTWPAEPLRRIVCAVDGSETAHGAAEAAIALAARSGAELLFVHVLDETLLRDLKAVLEDDGAEARHRLEVKASELLAHLSELARRHEVGCGVRLVEGDPPYEIDEVAREVDADVIVVGKVGQRGVRRWMVGSVTRRLIESTHVPVVVVPRPGDAPERGGD